MTAALGRGSVDRLAARGGVLGLAALALFVVIGLATKLPEDPGLAVAAALLALGAGVAIDRLDARFVLPGAAVATIGVAALGSTRASNVGWFAICVLGAWCVLRGGRWAGLSYWAGTLVLLGVEWVVDEDTGWGAWMAGLTFTMCAATLVAHEIGLVHQLREAQAGLAERSRAQERNRIARELHDVIAHSLTVSLLHVASARLAVEHEPEEAAASLAEAERLGRQSLDEVRGIVGLMGTPGGRAPVRGIDDLTELVDGFRRAGADVVLAVDGDLGRLPSTTGSVVYRILQEALTNAAKHAAGAPTAVRVAATGGRVELVVDSAAPPGAGVGQGTVGMLERARAVGGHCTAGPHHGGWRVHARLPLTSPNEPDAP